ncbi:MAG: cation:proton antiporter [Acholeplasmataceae bacterium]|nr:MAG: cation:proton antiporter [Acholeplasmataceae bacterium]
MLAYIILVVAWFFLIFGMISIFTLKNLYTRILTSATIDTVATFFLLIALMLISGVFGFIIRLLLMIIFLLITNPISSHVNIRSAYLTGIPVDHQGGEYR